MTDKTILVFFIFGLVLFFVGFWIYLRVDEKRCKKRNLAWSADQQHKAILRGDYARGSYGRFDPPHEFRYLAEPDWKADAEELMSCAPIPPSPKGEVF